MITYANAAIQTSQITAIHSIMDFANIGTCTNDTVVFILNVLLNK